MVPEIQVAKVEKSAPLAPILPVSCGVLTAMGQLGIQLGKYESYILEKSEFQIF